MRKDRNPFKNNDTSIEPPNSITVGVLVCIPELEGYFRGSFDTLKLCLASLLQNTNLPFDLLVLDNKSCFDVRNYLFESYESGIIDYLFFNDRNLGRPNGVRQILRAAPGDLVFYTDSDMFFRLGWIEAHLAIYNAFPNVGLVGGQPVRYLNDYYTKATKLWVFNHKQELDKYEEGLLIPENQVIEQLESFGYDVEQYLDKMKEMKDEKITFQNVTAYIGADHQQFLIPRRAIESLPHQRFDKATGLNHLIVDGVLDDAGFLRLSTEQSTVYHMGNEISEEWLKIEYERMLGVTLKKTTSFHDHWFWSRAIVRKYLRRLWKWSFSLYYRYGG